MQIASLSRFARAFFVCSLLATGLLIVGCDSGGSSSGSSGGDDGPSVSNTSSVMVEFKSSSSGSSTEASGEKANAKASGDLTVTFLYQNDSESNCTLSETDSGINTSDYNKSFDPTTISGNCNDPANFDGVKSEFSPGSGSSVNGLTLRILDEDGNELASNDGSGGNLSASATASDVTFPGDDGGGGGDDGTTDSFQGTIAFGGEDQDALITDIYTISSGEQPVQVTTDPSGDNSPTWKPDGSRIAFTTYRENVADTDIYSIKPSGDDPRGEAVNSDKPFQGASWGPDPNSGGSQIVFDKRSGPIYRIKSGESTPTRLTSESKSDSNPNLSSTGEKVVFGRYDSNSNSTIIHTMDANGSDVTSLEVEGRNPVWSPDGSRIAFSRETSSGDVEIFTISADGSGSPEPVTDNSVDDYVSDWMGTRLAFSSDRTEDDTRNGNIYTIGTDGNELAQVTNSDTDDREPVWKPSK